MEQTINNHIIKGVDRELTLWLEQFPLSPPLVKKVSEHCNPKNTSVSLGDVHM